MTVKVHAPAKINLALDVVGKLENGYHLLKMIMQTINLYDCVSVKAAKETSLVCNVNSVPTGSDNICIKAWEKIKEKYNLPGGIKIDIHKNIPVAAGMAGGSTNGAATVLAVNEEFGLEMTLDEMKAIGGTLGADVPYCIQQGTALAEGIGDKLTPLIRCPEIHVLAVNAGFPVSTVAVYKNLNINGIKQHPDVNAMVNAIGRQNAEGVLQNTGNVLETSAFNLFPQLAVTKKRIANLGLNALMSGSGGTMLGLTTDKELAEYALKKLKDEFPFAGVFATK